MAVETTDKVWLITGCSSGLGASIALGRSLYLPATPTAYLWLRASGRSSTTIAVLKRGQKAIVTCRGDAESRLKDLTAKGAAALSLDVTDTPAALAKTVKKAHGIYGRLDVLVNNAGELIPIYYICDLGSHLYTSGYVLQGATEELTAEDELAQYETNTFGLCE